MKFIKVRGKDRWRAKNGTEIWETPSGEYDIYRGCEYAWADTLDDAKELASHSPRFNPEGWKEGT